MTDFEMNCAIAEALGWYSRTIGSLPPFATDLNAMHEAEQRLQGQKNDEHSQKQEYYEHLVFVVGGYQQPADCYEWDLITATSQQRAEAFLRTLGKWKEPTQ